MPKLARPTRGILLLVAFTLSAMLLEGALIDWSVIYMRDVFEESAFVNGLALTLGALGQFIIRFFADPVVDRHGAERVARVSLIALALGAGVVSFTPNSTLALIGFVSLGAGTAVIFPLAISAAAQRGDRSSPENVAALAQFSFVTFLLAPPLLGFVAENFGIRYSFGILGFVLIAIMLGIAGLDFVTALSGAATSISNVGPGLGEVIGADGNFSTLPDSAKWIMTFAMLLGRLEIFTVLVMLNPAFWQR